MLYDLLGMIRQLGPCTWFLTLSAADLKWSDTIKVLAQQQGKTLSDDEINDLSWEDRCDFLRSNPVTAARHFDNRVQLFLKYILLNKQLNPLGNIKDYKYRIEFQQRGSPHVHMLAWIDRAPSVQKNTLEEVQQFIDRYITCELPENDDILHELLSTVQKHSHSTACRKHGEKCRFHFPRPPVKQTIVAKPPVDTPSAAMQEQYSAVLTAVHEQLVNLNPGENISVDQLLQRASVTESLYEKALIWIATKNGQPAVLLKRSPAEVNINNYNRSLMLAWQANLDVQYVTNTYACVLYVASYVSKPEKTLGDILKAVSASGEHLGPKTSMKSVAKKFLTHREVSAQEAIYRLMSLPLIQGSRQVVFVPTDLPEQRTRLFKPMKLIEMLEDDDPDVYMRGILEYYAARPSQLSEVTLAEFATKYKKSSNKTPENDPGEKKIQLQKGLGTMIQRATPPIIRYPQCSEKKQAEQFYHSQLLLYFPWRDEENDLCNGSYKEKYDANEEIIKHNKKIYEYHASEVECAMESMEEFGIPEESWNILAPQDQQSQFEDRAEGNTELPTVSNMFDHSNSSSVNQDLGIVPHEVEFSNERMTKSEWYDHLLSLNHQQSKVHDFIVRWCTQMLLSHKCRRPDPFHIFLTGGAGVGKSHLVRAIVQTINNSFERNNQSQEMHVMVCAPTGAAAYNISGYTLHAAFHLPLNVKHSDDYIPLSGERLAALKETIGNIKVLIIDEISMVGSDMLLTVHRRLCDLMGNHQPFGGISVLAVGDLLQLPPVAQKAVFSCPSDEMAAIYGPLWHHFQIVELKEIQRQKNDAMFALLLNRVRDGTHTSEDMEILQRRVVQSNDEAYPMDATHIFAYNKDVYEHNMRRLESLQSPKFVFTAEDSRKDDQTALVETTNLKDMAGGLAKSVTISVGAKVMLTKNLDVQDGLVNSAIGIVTGFYPQPQEDQDIETFKPKFIFVKFSDARVGRRNRLQSTRILRDNVSTPIPQVESQIRFGRHSKITAKRSQFPLCLAWAVTIHKEQGKQRMSL
ncbi:uncharacterized protein LOC134261665 [Saccostrea cucullata]|uniref:uncharacterized protein LOC134261665 n=1 Tax=Saccostrea cuccullata TaxID=36930 RepID=UPI002ED68154